MRQTQRGAGSHSSQSAAWAVALQRGTDGRGSSLGERERIDSAFDGGRDVGVESGRCSQLANFWES